jgi:hypothetical protein
MGYRLFFSVNSPVLFLNGFKLDFSQWKALNRAKIAKIGAPRRIKNRGVFGYLGTSPPCPKPFDGAGMMHDSPTCGSFLWDRKFATGIQSDYGVFFGWYIENI